MRGDVVCPQNHYALATVETGMADPAERLPPPLANSRKETNHRWRPRHAACAASIGSSFLLPTSKPASDRSSRSSSPRKNGRRLTSASSFPYPASFLYSDKCRVARWWTPRVPNALSPALPSPPFA